MDENNVYDLPIQIITSNEQGNTTTVNYVRPEQGGGIGAFSSHISTEYESSTWPLRMILFSHSVA